MQNKKINIWNKITMAVLVTAPILEWYEIPFPVGLGRALILFIGAFMMLKSRFKIQILHWTYIPLFIYVCGQWCMTHNFELWTLLPPGGWIYFIFIVGLLGGIPQFDLELLKKYMKYVLWIAIPLFFIQFLLLETTGSIQICFVPPLTQEFTYENLTYAELVRRHLLSDHPCSIFLEKSYMAYYLVAYLCLIWFDFKNKDKIITKEVAVIIVTLILLRSGSGIIGIGVLTIAKIYSVFWTKNTTRRVLMILFVIPFVVGVYYAYQKTESGQEIYSRHEEFSTEGSSGYVRVVAGYIMYGMMTPQEQMIGKPDARAAFGIEKTDGTTRFYINGVQTILIYLGYMGALLYLLFYGSVFRKVNTNSRMCILVLLATALLESNYLNPFMLLLTIIPCADYYNTKRNISK